MIQGDLLSDTPIARNSDPSTSHEAAAKIKPVRATQQRAILAGLQKFPNHTSAELAQRLHMDRYVVARRLPELRAALLVKSCEARSCAVTGHRAMVWRAV